MFVDPEVRGRGAGGLLLGAVIAQARIVVEDLVLAVAHHNQPAVRLYRRFGFVDCRALKLTDSYVDELLMRLALD